MCELAQSDCPTSGGLRRQLCRQALNCGAQPLSLPISPKVKQQLAAYGTEVDQPEPASQAS